MEEEQQNPTTKIVLVIENNQICRTILSSHLEHSYTVDIALDAKTAIQKLFKQTYVLILTDLRLPDKPGTEVIKAARAYEANQGTALIVLSAQLSKKDFPSLRKLGADEILIKPVSLEVLESSIQSCYQTPYYQRKFFHQLRACVKALKNYRLLPQTKAEFQRWREDFQALLT